ncbi:cytochrome c oxidase subunit VA-domain-containing protein [Cokeromyces recurvatus]|uniref:cytochrome c oxidase subunit VA-domain-containing protein n=1 Tax=Cokeromyces recurvatus TaxID=90255 RepID=UPI002220BDB2|nr:cytochrome c oxidase subunit VA-domain-containing protein [Cokeromyces recurvatus]KAI7903169.1 cytochrome c oxidase subunit VA-domain-containing protein [Cokeromyces recurvatus]
MLRAAFTGSVSRIAVRSAIPAVRPLTMAMGKRLYSSGHEDESFESFTERYVKFFDGVEDLFELQRGLNNAFAYDLVPAPSVIEAALRASRRVNDFATAVRVFEGLRDKVENDKQYEQYLEELAPIRNELGVMTKEELSQ